MYNFYFSLIIILFFGYAKGQIGIGTDTPQAMLDIRGDLRIESIANGSEAAARDSVLVLNGSSFVNKVSAKNVISSALNSCTKVTSGSTVLSLVTISALPNWKLAKLPNVEFDMSCKFNPDTNQYDLDCNYNATTGEFVALQDGIYEIYAQIKTSNVLGANTDFGVGIFKIDTTNNYSLLAEESYLNININILSLNVNVSPPARKTKTIVKLQAGERIVMGIKTGLATINLIGGSNSFMYINQIR